MTVRLFFKDPATTAIYTLSLHDALPIYPAQLPQTNRRAAVRRSRDYAVRENRNRDCGEQRSEEHMSELQSDSDLVCRLLLEKKKHDAAERGLPHAQRVDIHEREERVSVL